MILVGDDMVGADKKTMPLLIWWVLIKEDALEIWWVP